MNEALASEDMMQLPPQMGRQIADDTLGSLRFQLSNDEIIYQIRETLTNITYVKDKDGRIIKYSDPNSEPLINEKGLQYICSVLTGTLNKVVILSDLDEDDILMHANHVNLILIKGLVENHKDFEIKNTTTQSTILNIVMTVVYATLRKAKHGNYYRGLRTMHSIQEIQQGMVRPAQSAQSMSDKIGGMIFRKRR